MNFTTRSLYDRPYIKIDRPPQTVYSRWARLPRRTLAAPSPAHNSHIPFTSPPSMSMVAPCSQRPRGDTMKATRPPMSSGVPKRVTPMS